MPPSREPASDADSVSTFADVAPEAMVQVGFVFRPHGMEGELKVNPEHTDDPARFEDLDTVYIGRTPHQVTRHTIASVRYQQTKRGTTVILGLSDVETRDDAEAIAKLHVFAHEDDLELAEDEVFIHDLVGLEVVTEEGERIGTVANYMEMPAQDVFVVTRPNTDEAMIPAVEDFIVDIDLEGGQLVVRLVEGLLE
ncbi:MAG TPA: ribosome maturation factor RimM [Salinibacter sp.]|nr:ribosome maturation factor RimM [Salinibacter sp.]